MPDDLVIKILLPSAHTASDNNFSFARELRLDIFFKSS